LIEKGSGTIIGAAYLKDSLSTLERSKHRLHYRRHRVPLEPGQKVHKGKYLFPWVMEKAFRLAKPVAYIDDFDLAPAEPSIGISSPRWPGQSSTCTFLVILFLVEVGL
jgi:hypothetical protein